MKRYEYIRLPLDMGDLSELNRFSGDGWRVAALIRRENRDYLALLERELPPVGGESK